MGTYLAIGVVLAIVAVLGFKRFARKGFERGRTPMPLADIHRTVQDQISIGVFNEVWSKVGEAKWVEAAEASNKAATLNITHKEH